MEQLRRKANERHRMTNSVEYRTWSRFIDRCTNAKNNSYPRYGAAGIGVCDEWRQSFRAFFAHIGPRPSPLHSIDRIDGTKGYKPGNVRWATKKEQGENRKTSRLLTINGETHCLSEWARRYGIHRDTVQRRMDKHGRSFLDAVTTRASKPPPRKYDDATVAEIGRVHSYGVSLTELGRLFGLSYHTVARYVARPAS